ncbi:MAG: WecB/TagA/CpsF family glycosyltransferase [Lachnospiraceae bacterium]|nr:WecB/TagA/CpsF family glycosyltransferase [Lachnospiraceae bacterium]
MLKMKKIEIMGVEIDNYSVRESLLLADAYLNNHVMNTIEYVTMDAVNKASKDSHYKEQLEKIDLLLPGEKEMLDVYGMKDNQRKKEIGEHLFFVEFLRKVVRLEKRVFIIGDKESAILMVSGFLKKYYEELHIVGATALEQNNGDIANVINAINAEAPDVILSVLPSPLQENFLEEQNDKLCAKVWFGFGNSYRKRSGLMKIVDEMIRMFRKALLLFRITKYQNER